MSTPGWQKAFNGNEFSLSEAIGGVRGAVESLLPGVVFVVTFVVSGSLAWTIGLSAGISVLFCIIRIFQRTPITQALAGLIGVVIGIVWALSSGQAENYYAWGLLTNVAYAVVLFLSILIRQPLIAWGLQFLWSLPKGWMRSREPLYRVLFRRAVWVTWVWVIVFALRLAVQLPLYFAGAVAALGIAKLVMGLPLFALGAWFTWVLLRELRPKETPAQ